jgi:5-methylcytosine-specific restriction endonuclease McrA
MRHSPLSTARWQRTRVCVLDRDGHTCQIAGPGCTIVATTVDHVVARSDGGAVFDPANLRAACQHCNASREHPARIAGLMRHMGYTYRVSTAPTHTRM